MPSINTAITRLLGNISNRFLRCILLIQLGSSRHPNTSNIRSHVQRSRVYSKLYTLIQVPGLAQAEVLWQLQ
jgi:hypothetical protein